MATQFTLYNYYLANLGLVLLKKLVVWDSVKEKPITRNSMGWLPLVCSYCFNTTVYIN